MLRAKNDAQFCFDKAYGLQVSEEMKYAVRILERYPPGVVANFFILTYATRI